MNALGKLSNATRMLAEVRSATDAKKLMDLAGAAEYYAHKARCGDEAINHAHAIKIEAQRMLGGFLKTEQRHKGGRRETTRRPCRQVAQSQTLGDLEFAALIPPLAPEELALLTASIITEGCRDPLVVWRGILVDGHNRFAICKAHGVKFQTREIEFADREAAKLWIEENQAGRRNLTDDQRAVIGYSIAQRRAVIASKERASTGGKAGGVSRPKISLEAPVGPQANMARSRAGAAKEMKVSERKLRRVAAIAKGAPGKLEAIRRGEATIADTTREMKRKALRADLENIETKKAKALTGVFDVIVIDPPWPMEKIERDVRPNQSELDYPTMTETQLAAMKIPAAADCHVWLWTTHRFLPMALRLLDAWDLKYVCTFVWHKPGGYQPIGLPQFNCEFSLYARKGAPKFLDTKAFPVCFEAQRGKHSEKPESFYEVVRRVTGGRRVDMFNRRKIEDFEGWGQESQ